MHEIAVGDCLQLSLVIDDRSLRANKGMGFYQLLHTMGVFVPQAPSTIRAFGTIGQLSPAQLIDRYAITCRPVRDLLVAYLQERQPALDHTTLRNLAFNLRVASSGGISNATTPGLPRRACRPRSRSLETANADQDETPCWLERQTIEVRERRAGGQDGLAAVRALHLDISQWAMEDPARWALRAAPCPVRPEDLARQKELRSRKSRMDQRSRERLPIF